MIDISITSDQKSLGAQAAALAGKFLREILDSQPSARMVMATGASQFEMLAALIQEPGIDWTRLTVFHLDEYVGLTETHPASFRKYLKDRFTSRVPLHFFHEVRGDAIDPSMECHRLNALIAESPLDLGLIGIGENGHIAFNDPPADFQTEQPYIIVQLDLDCRQQQVGEGWFESLREVPGQAISMSVNQIMKCRRLISVCLIYGKRKPFATLSQDR